MRGLDSPRKSVAPVRRFRGDTVLQRYFRFLEIRTVGIAAAGWTETVAASAGRNPRIGSRGIGIPDMPPGMAARLRLIRLKNPVYARSPARYVPGGTNSRLSGKTPPDNPLPPPRTEVSVRALTRYFFRSLGRPPVGFRGERPPRSNSRGMHLFLRPRGFAYAMSRAQAQVIAPSGAAPRARLHLHLRRSGQTLGP
jgi:hypothetical protein